MLTTWINEFHYDNAAGDVDEFVEVAGTAGTDLTGFSIELYNGGNGTRYATIELSGTIDDEAGGVGALSFDHSGMQNGPDGIALVDSGNNVVEFVSYEGTFDAVDGAASGLTSEDVVVVEGGSTLIGESLQRLSNSADSEWTGPSIASPGSLNSMASTSFSIRAVDAVKPEGDLGNTVFSFEVVRSGETNSEDSVDYGVSVDGPDAADASDFEGGVLPSGTVLFAAGETVKAVEILVSGDAIDEPTEGFTVSLINASTTGAISGGSATGMIQNDDGVSPTIWLNEFHYDNVGGDEGEIVEVAGAAGVDLDGASVVLYNGGNGQSYRTVDLTGTIDDEGKGLGAISFDVSGIQNGPDGIALVNTDGSVVEFISYEGAFVAVDGPAVGMTSTDVVVFESTSNAIGATLQRLSNTAGGDWSGPLSGSPGRLNAGSTDLPSISIVATDAAKAEGDDGTTTYLFEVRRFGNSSGSSEVDYEVSSSDANEDDFVGGSFPMGTASFLAGETTASIGVEVAGDLDEEADEVFTVTLSDPSDGASISARTAAGTIVNDDTSVPMSPVNIWLNEFHYDNTGSDVGESVEIAGAAGLDIAGASIVLYNGGNGEPYSTIDLSGVIDDEGAGQGALSFDVSGIQNGPDGIALINTDGSLLEFLSYEGAFMASSGPAVGTTSTDVGVFEPTSSTVGESLQRITNTSGSAWSGPTLASPGSLNSVSATVFHVSAIDAVKAEGNSGTTSFLFEITRSGDSSEVHDIQFAVSSSVADANDFVGGMLPSGTLSFAVGETAKSVDIGVAGDADAEPNEAFTVTISGPTNGAILGNSTADGTIENDDELILTAEIDVTGGDRSIASGDLVPDVADGTDFGSVNAAMGFVVRAFTIANVGGATLDNIEVSLSGAGAAGFTLGDIPNSIAPNSSETLNITFDPLESGLSSAVVTILSNDQDEGNYTFGIQGAGFQPPTSITINEVDSDQAGSDAMEFIELYDGGIGATGLDGLVLVLFNGGANASYGTVDLTGLQTNPDGFLVIGDEGVPGVAKVLSSLQNGEDAVALYVGSPADFPNGTPPTSNNLLDAVVYETGNDADTDLATLLGTDGVHQDSPNESVARAPDGTGNFVSLAPSPDRSNGAVSAPQVESLRLYNGVTLLPNNRVGASQITSLVVTFDTEVEFDGAIENAFELRNETSNLDVTGFAATVDDLLGKSVVTISSFSGVSVDRGESLADGDYTLRTSFDQISANGQQLDGDRDGTPSPDATDTFFRLFGDEDGDGTVDVDDFRDYFAPTLGSSRDDEGYDQRFDFDADGRISYFDYFQFYRRFS